MSKRALLVGINEFAGRPEWLLRGCVNDSQAMTTLLKDLYGFTGEEIRVLNDSQATTQALRENLSWLLSRYAGDGSDVRLFHFASHGTQVAADGDDTEADQVDEVIVPYDHDWNTPFKDDHLRQIFEDVPENVAFTFLADCCHSGSINKLVGEEGTETDIVPRYVAPPEEMGRAVNKALAARTAKIDAWVDDQMRSPEVRETLSDASFTEREAIRSSLRNELVNKFWAKIRGEQASPEGGQILIAACRDDQTAADAFIKGMYRGAFTWSLVTALNESAGKISHADLLARSRHLLSNYTQIPQLDADDASQKRQFLAPLG